MIAFSDPAAFGDALRNLPAPDADAIVNAAERQAELTKPSGSLGRLEDIALFMAGWQGTACPGVDRIHIAVFAGNHGVAARGVSAFPADVTAQMVANFQAGGAAINALARALSASFAVHALNLDRPTEDIAEGPAMTTEECLAALTAGAASVPADAQLLIVGEMGIANTTPAAALAAIAYGGSAQDWVGRGSGVGAEALDRKARTVAQALALHGPHCTEPFETLRRLGGREIAAMAGAMLAARHARIPVLLDGFIASAALATLAAAHPAVVDHCLAAHRSAEGAHGALLDRLGLVPLLDLGMRLGEGSGAAVAAHIVRAALATHGEMATFAEAAVSAGTS